MVPNGVYTLSLVGRDDFLGVEKQQAGTTALIAECSELEYIQWEIEGQEDAAFSIRSRGSNLYLAPRVPEEILDNDFVTLQDQKFDWRIIEEDNEFTMSLDRSSFGIYPRPASIRFLWADHAKWRPESNAVARGESQEIHFTSNKLTMRFTSSLILDLSTE
ncbi:hypothetical protein BGZ65_012106 [Modicella reniformis]|uniref:Uncharacterized protein n=1 Tax=Modicella reniformis TaxID=1440133 RepID=A0A9P6IQH0_9FUNG|nr:hypothetical protein BGZ65_012106 [Modicella reniformis]